MLAEAFAAVVAALEEGPRLQPSWAVVVPPEPQPEGYATGIPVGPHLSASFASGVFKWGPVVAEPPAFDSCEGVFHGGYFLSRMSFSIFFRAFVAPLL